MEKENNVNKKAIYYGFYEQDWFDSSSVVNFKKDIIDLIEVGDMVEVHKAYNEKGTILYHMIDKEYTETFIKGLEEKEIVSILTHEQFKQNAYEVEG